MTEEEIQERWEENRQAVQDAKTRVLTNFRVYALVREQVSGRARRRDPRYPVLNAEERTLIDQHREAWEDAKTELAEAQERFKAGVVEE